VTRQQVRRAARLVRNQTPHGVATRTQAGAAAVTGPARAVRSPTWRSLSTQTPPSPARGLQCSRKPPSCCRLSLHQSRRQRKRVPSHITRVGAGRLGRS